MPENEAVLIYVTVPDIDSGKRIAKEVVEHGLAACANLIPKIYSIYRWDGEVQEDNETLVFLKTGRDRADALIEAIAEAHPYEVPAISEIRLDNVHDPYLAWLLE